MVQTIELNLKNANQSHQTESFEADTIMATFPDSKLRDRGVFVKTYGCQMNEYDSRKMLELLQQSHALYPVKDEESADVVLLNTCSVREKAQEKVFTQLGTWKRWKQQKANRIIGIGGCVASQEGEFIKQRAPYVDIIFGPQTLHRLPHLVEQVIQKKQSVIDISFPEIEKFDCLPEAVAEGVTAFVSVMEGCSKYCSFCVVPYTRGEEFSRPLQQVLDEVELLSNQGVREVTLLGQNVNAYWGEYADGSPCDFATLITEVAAIDGIERVRFTTSHPLEMTESLIQCFVDVPQLVSQIHLPVQSGSDKILSLMKRGYTATEYKQIIQQLREVNPNVELSSDFIVGFPGETDQDFEETMELIEEVKFNRSFSFIYSARPGTPASDLIDDTPMEVKKQRLYRLQSVLNRQARASALNLIGSHQVALIERLSRNDEREVAGRIDNSLVVNLPGSQSLIGQFVSVEITDAYTNSLKGRLVQ